MSYSIILGFAAALGWAVSSAFWIRSTLVRFEGIKGAEISSEHFDGYFRRTGSYNAWAGMLSAISAVLSAGSLFSQSMGW